MYIKQTHMQGEQVTFTEQNFCKHLYLLGDYVFSWNVRQTYSYVTLV